MSGKKKAKSYSSADELFMELDAENGKRTEKHTDLFDKKRQQKKSG